MKRLFFLILLISFLISSVSAAPAITDWNNTETNDQDLYPVIENGVSRNFEITTNETITTYTWIVDGSNVSNNYDNLSRSFTIPYTHNITVTATNPNGSDSLTWFPQIERAIGITTSETANETAYNNMLTAFEDDTDYQGFLLATILPYENVLGAFIWVFIWGSYFVIAWMRQENILNASIVGLIVGVILFAYLPEDWSVSAVPLIILGATATIFSLYRERS